MFADTHSGRLEETGRRRAGVAVRVAGLAVVVAAGLVAAAPAAAQSATGYATVFTHSAGSGQLKDGRLTLRGVNGRVTWATNAGRSGRLSVRKLHRVIRPGKPATGTLHVAGHRGGDEPTFRLSRPRYNRARRTVSYSAKPLDNHRLPGRAARAAGAARRFGAASLSIVPHPALMGGASGGYTCKTSIQNESNHSYTASSASLDGEINQAWSESYPNPAGKYLGHMMSDSNVGWWSVGANPGDGCANTVRWQVSGTNDYVTISTSWSPADEFQSSCDAPGGFVCSGEVSWQGFANWTIKGG